MSLLHRQASGPFTFDDRQFDAITAALGESHRRCLAYLNDPEPDANLVGGWISYWANELWAIDSTARVLGLYDDEDR